MRARVQKWGNSLALRIPKTFATEIGLDQNSSVEMSLVEETLLVIPADRQKYSLKQLLSRVTKNNLHREADTGPAVGGEIW